MCALRFRHTAPGPENLDEFTLMEVSLLHYIFLTKNLRLRSKVSLCKFYGSKARPLDHKLRKFLSQIFKLV